MNPGIVSNLLTAKSGYEQQVGNSWGSPSAESEVR